MALSTNQHHDVQMLEAEIQKHGKFNAEHEWVCIYIYSYFELLIISVFLGGHSSFALGHIGQLTSRLHHLEEEGESVAPVEDAEGKDRGGHPDPC